MYLGAVRRRSARFKTDADELGDDLFRDPIATDAIVNQQPVPSSSRDELPAWGTAMLDFVERARQQAAAAHEAAQEDIRAVAEGRPRPSEADPNVTIRVGSEVYTGGLSPLTQEEAREIVAGTWEESPYAPPEEFPIGAPAPGPPVLQAGAAPEGLGPAIERSAVGDMFERVGLPRGAAPLAVGVLAAIALGQSIRFSAGG